LCINLHKKIKFRNTKYPGASLSAGLFREGTFIMSLCFPTPRFLSGFMALRRLSRGLALLAALAGGWLGAAGLARAQATPYATIGNPSGPITNIYVGNELGLQIERFDSAQFQVYPPAGIPGDYGTFAVIDDGLYAPNFGARPSATGIATGNSTPFAPVSQSAITGAGTRANPYAITTTVDAGATGIRLVQTLTYVAGDDFFDTQTRLVNTGASDKTVLLYRAMDCFLGGSDEGFGLVLPNPPDAPSNIIACAKYDATGALVNIEGLTFPPSTPGMEVHYEVNGYRTIWDRIIAHEPFADMVYNLPIQYDNGVGVSWEVTVPAGGELTVPNTGMFAPAIPLRAGVSVSPSSAAAGAQVTYTVTVTNDNADDAPLATLTATLPAAFSYVAGSTGGGLSANPVITGPALAWDASALTVPAGGSVTFTFRATAAGVARSVNTITVEGEVASSSNTVIPATNAAPVTILDTSISNGDNAPVPTLGELALALLAALLAGGAVAGMRRA
jgi:uncharacterized repeat protein (TIGR01451 family)